MTATDIFDAMSPDEARVLQAVSKLTESGLPIWQNAMPSGLAESVDRLLERGLVDLQKVFTGGESLVVTTDGFDLLAAAPWWDAPWFVPDTPGWLTDAWYARNVMGMTIKITRRGSEAAGTSAGRRLPYSVTAVKARPNHDWPAIGWLLGDLGPIQTPSTRWDEAVRRADDLVAAQEVEVAFLRLRRSDGRIGWGCRIARGAASVISDGSTLTGCFADQNLQGTVLCHAAWLAMTAGILPPIAAPVD